MNYLVSVNVVALLLLVACSDGDPSPDNSMLNDPPGGGSGPLLDITNYKRTVAAALGYFGNESFAGPELPRLAELQARAPSSVEIETADPLVKRNTYNCDNAGGSYVIRDTGEPEQAMTFINCELAGLITDGRVTVTSSRYRLYAKYQSFYLKDSDKKIIRNINGELEDATSAPPCQTNKTQRNLNNYTVTFNNELVELTDWAINASHPAGASQLCTAAPFLIEGSFNLESTVTGGEKIHVAIEKGLSGIGTKLDKGRLLLSASDGSSISIDADNGDSNTVRVSVSFKNQADQFEEPWSSWESSLFDIIVSD